MPQEYRNRVPKRPSRSRRTLLQLEAQDRITRPDRARRYSFLLREFGPDRDMMFVGGVFAARAYQEAIACYLDACFVGCVVLCQIVLEHSLAGVFQLSGEEGLDGAGFFRLLREAERVGMFTNDEVRAFDEVRKLRNEYTHGKDGGMAWLLRRGTKYTSTFDALEEDATLALRALGRVIREDPVKRRRGNSRRTGRPRSEVPTSGGLGPHRAELDRTRRRT